MAKERILIVEDEGIVAEDLRRGLQTLGYTVSGVVASGEDAIRLAGEVKPDLILMGIMLRGLIDGIQASGEIRAKYGIPIIFVTANADDTTLDRAKLTDPFGYLLKPFEERELHSTIEIALYKHKATAQLRESEERLRHIIQNMPVMILALDMNNRIVTWNREAEHVTGYTGEEVLCKQDAISLLIPDDDSRRKILTNTAGTDGDRYAAEFKMHCKDGKTRVVQWLDISQRFPIPGWALWGVGIDVTQKKRNETQLRKLSQAVEQSPSSIVITDTTGNIEYVNPKFSDITGYAPEEVMGKNPRILKSEKTPADVYRELWGTILNGKEWHGELQNKRKSGELFLEYTAISPVKDETGVVTHFVAVKEDITAKKRQEAQFFRAERMDSLGTLAGGIAHDLNNVLAPIQMATYILKKSMNDEQQAKWLETIQTSVTRAASIVRQVLTFARGDSGDRTVLQPKHLIKEMETIAKETFPRSISVERKIEGELWTVKGDPTQLHQVLLNFCVNARDAMPDGGTLTIKAENVKLDDNYARMNIEAKPGPYVAIEVSDTGSGIPPGILEKIFEPFFTTKPVGKGTGLGLSTVVSIVKAHNGFVNVYSEVGRGTQFKIYLPATAGAESAQASPEAVAIPRGNDELVLVVDDEPSICSITTHTLEEYGYRAISANDGVEALAMFIERKAEVKIVVTDIMMPYMDGNAVIRALRKMNPSVKILATSGLIKHHEQFEYDGEPVLFLQKPYTAEKLLTVMAQLSGIR